MGEIYPFIAMPSPFLKDNYLVWWSAPSDVPKKNGKKCEVVVFLILVVASHFSD